MRYPSFSIDSVADQGQTKTKPTGGTHELIVDAYLYLSISESIACPIDVAVSHE